MWHMQNGQTVVPGKGGGIELTGVFLGLQGGWKIAVEHTSHWPTFHRMRWQ